MRNSPIASSFLAPGVCVGEAGSPPPRYLLHQIVPGHNMEGLTPFPFQFWKQIYVAKISAGSEEE